MPIDERRGMGLEPDRSSRHSIGIHAAPAEVYHALTDPGTLCRWFAAEAGLDARAGGEYRWVFETAPDAGDEGRVESAGTVIGVSPGELLRLSAMVDGQETEIEFRCEPWRDGTLFTLTHSGLPGEESWDATFRSIDQGWASETQTLKLYLERARGMVRRSTQHEARLPATAEDLFECVSSRAGLEGWLAERAAADGAPGGELRLEWPDRPAVTGHFAVWDPDRFLVMTWEGVTPAVVRLWLEEVEGGGETLLSLEHRQFAPDASPPAPFDWPGALRRLHGMLSARAAG